MRSRDAARLVRRRRRERQALVHRRRRERQAALLGGRLREDLREDRRRVGSRAVDVFKELSALYFKICPERQVILCQIKMLDPVVQVQVTKK